MSVSAVHKRLQKLIDDGTINNFVALPMISSFNYIWLLTTGKTQGKTTNKIMEELGQNENINFVAVSGGKFFYIISYLRNISELYDYSVQVSKIAKIDNPQIGIINIPYKTNPVSLTPMDFSILKYLSRNSRMPATELADLIGLSPKTVKNRIEKMVSNRLIYCTIEFTPKAENNFMTVFHLYLKEGLDINQIITYLNQKFSKNLVYCLTYSNIPNYMTMHTWTKSSIESQKIHEELTDDYFKEVMPRIILFGKYYDCWLYHLQGN
jgi:DNA-binding Lrp family transcriptional regulator